MVGVPDGLGRVERLPDPEFHVRLTGTDPNIADQNIVEDKVVAIAPGDADFDRLAVDRQRGELHDPFSTGVRARLTLAWSDGDLDFFPRLRRAPKQQLRVLLEDHVVAEDRGHRHRRRRADQNHREKKCQR